MEKLAAIEKRMLAAADQQNFSLTDPDSRSMATSGRGSGVVGYNVQVAVDTEHHLIVTHEVTNVGNDTSQLAHMGKQAKTVLETDKPRSSLTVATSTAKRPPRQPLQRVITRPRPNSDLCELGLPHETIWWLGAIRPYDQHYAVSAATARS